MRPSAVPAAGIPDNECSMSTGTGCNAAVWAPHIDRDPLTAIRR